MSSEGHKTKTVVTTYCHLEQVSLEHYCGWGAFTVPEKLKVVIESSERKLMAWDLREGAFELEKRVWSTHKSHGTGPMKERTQSVTQ